MTSATVSSLLATPHVQRLVATARAAEATHRANVRQAMKTNGETYVRGSLEAWNDACQAVQGAGVCGNCLGEGATHEPTHIETCHECHGDGLAPRR